MNLRCHLVAQTLSTRHDQTVLTGGHRHAARDVTSWMRENPQSAPVAIRTELPTPDLLAVASSREESIALQRSLLGARENPAGGVSIEGTPQGSLPWPPEVLREGEELGEAARGRGGAG